ncbi:MAG TPA: cysteine desulfurase family protein [Patescibacteria group bacterium]|jgi:cysteine desulfurase|nr:cysteine desulfurase family protein [Patescibacteria group bacterium]
MSQIYLDYAAATPLDERVLQAMQPYLQDQFYNPSSAYLASRKVKAAIEAARARVAYWLGAKSSEIVFTAGATESINIAIHGVMRHFKGGNVCTIQIEHDAVLASVAAYDNKIIPVYPNGLLNLDVLGAAIDNKTVLVSIGYGNNEIGTIQPLREVSQLIAIERERRLAAGNDLPIYLHTDASQAAAYLDLHVSRLGVDLMTINGGKIYGPKQTGVLFVRAGVKMSSFINGGGQESGLRSGTENVPGVIGLAEALDIAQADRKAVATQQAELRDELQNHLRACFPNMVVNGNLKKRLPNNLHVSWPGIDGERLVMQLDEQGLQAATGSACAANKNRVSHVLKALGLDDSMRQGSLRLTLGSKTTTQDIELAAEIITKSVNTQLV